MQEQYTLFAAVLEILEGFALLRRGSLNLNVPDFVVVERTTEFQHQVVELNKDEDTFFLREAPGRFEGSALANR